MNETPLNVTYIRIRPVRSVERWVRLGRRLLVASVPLNGLAALCFWMEWSIPGQVALWLAVAAFVTPIFLWLSKLRTVLAPWRAATITLSEEEVTIGTPQSTTSLRTGDVAFAFVPPDDGEGAWRPRARLELASEDTIDIRSAVEPSLGDVVSHVESRLMPDRIQVDRAPVVARFLAAFAAVSAFQLMTKPLLDLVAHYGELFPLKGVAAFLPLAAGKCAEELLRWRLTIGIDGVTLRRPFRSFHAAWRAVDRIHVSDGVLQVDLEGEPPRHIGLPAKDSVAIEEALARAVERYRPATS